MFEIYLITKSIKYFLLSPIYLYLLFGIFSLIISVLYYYFYDDKINLYNFDVVTSQSFFKIIKLYILALISFSLGVIFYYEISNKNLKRLFNKSFSEKLFFKVKTSKNLIKNASNLLILILFLYLLVYGKSIFVRDIYLPDVSRGGIIIIKILSFIEAVMLAFAFNDNKFKSRLYLLILLIISIGTGSRTVFLSLLIYILIVFITQGNSFKNKIKFFINLMISFVFLAYLIQFRSLKSHGVYPYIMSLGEVNNSMKSIIFNLYYSLIFGVYVTIKTLQEAPKNWYLIYVSLNPLPGKFVGWYDHIHQFKLNKFAPYSLHGTVFKMGKLFTILYFFITGVIFSFMEKKIRQYLSKNQRTLAFVLTLLLMLHIVYGFEYPLRSAFRYIYYSYFVVLVVYSFKILKSYLKKSRKEKNA